MSLYHSIVLLGCHGIGLASTNLPTIPWNKVLKLVTDPSSLIVNLTTVTRPFLSKVTSLAYTTLWDLSFGTSTCAWDCNSFHHSLKLQFFHYKKDINNIFSGTIPLIVTISSFLGL